MSGNFLATVTKKALPAIGADLLTTAVSISPQYNTLRVDFNTDTSGQLTVTFPGSSDTGKLMGGSTLEPGYYQFEIQVQYGETVNFTYSATGGNYRLFVSEA